MLSKRILLAVSAIVAKMSALAGASAITVFTPTSSTVTHGTGATASASQTTAPGGSSSYNQITAATSAPLTSAFFSAEQEVQVNYLGAPGTVLANSTIPVAYDFIVSNPGSTAVSWNALFKVLGSSGNYDVDPSGTVAANTTLEVKGTATIPNPVDVIDGYQLELTTTAGSTPFTVSTSIGDDLVLNGTSVPTAVPEPASGFLAMIGLAGLLRRKKR